MKILTFLLFFIIFSIYSFFNLGNFLDATEEPSKTQLLVCLGGGDYQSRIRKSAEILEKNLVESNTIILTSFVNSNYDLKKGISEDKRKIFLDTLDLKDLNIILNKDLKNTAEEIKFIKRYMLKNNMNEVTIVSEPAHSRRILLYSIFIKIKNDENLKFKVIGSFDKKWDANNFYQNKYSLIYSLTELTKIFYGIFTYGILDKLGILDSYENLFKSDIKQLKEEIHKYIYKFNS